ncbi:MAG TPA: YceH family protein [Bryobacteraceae bacterium]|nr:YceH family protein [Bryobacteraceae bacterium]
MQLNQVEIRVLGALIEKDMTTPDYYPMSLNALVNACNQKTNREPVTSYDDGCVMEALEALRGVQLAVFVHESGSRVEKFRHRLGESFNFTRGELAVMAVLMLRGPQTVAELRERAARLHVFEDSSAVEHTLHRLEGRQEQPLAKLLPRLSGMKESRWAQLLGGEPDWSEDQLAAPAQPNPAGLAERVENLEAELRALRAEFQRFREQFQ